MEAPSLISRRDNVWDAEFIHQFAGLAVSIGHDGVRNEFERARVDCSTLYFLHLSFALSLFCSLHHINLQYSSLWEVLYSLHFSSSFLINSGWKTKALKKRSKMHRPYHFMSHQQARIHSAGRAESFDSCTCGSESTSHAGHYPQLLGSHPTSQTNTGKGEAYGSIFGSGWFIDAFCFFTTFYCSRGHCRTTAAINQLVVFINQPITETNWTWVPGLTVCFRQLQWDGSSKTCAPVCPRPFGIG